MDRPRRIAIISSASGNGKTTLGRELARCLDVPFVELDALVHGPAWRETPDDALRAQLMPILASDAWVIDGQYLHKIGHLVLDAADVVLWLDLPVPVWLARLALRTARRMITRQELWNGNRESLGAAFKGRDALFAYAIRTHRRRQREWPDELGHLPVLRLRTPEQVGRARAWICASAEGRVAAVPATLYWFAMSHPSMAARKMLELKGVPFRSVRILPGSQRAVLRMLGFRGGTVPALVLDGQRIQGSRAIARALDELRPEPELFPTDPQPRTRVQEAEQWGERELQEVPRIVFRWGLVNDMALRRWFGEDAGFPMPALAARFSGPATRYYARVIGADATAAQRALARLEGMLDHVDALLDDGTLRTNPPNAAALQVLSTVRALDAFTDLHAQVEAHPAAAVAREVFPEYPGPVPRFIPPEWLRG